MSALRSCMTLRNYTLLVFSMIPCWWFEAATTFCFIDAHPEACALWQSCDKPKTIESVAPTLPTALQNAGSLHDAEEAFMKNALTRSSWWSQHWWEAEKEHHWNIMCLNVFQRCIRVYAGLDVIFLCISCNTSIHSSRKLFSVLSDSLGWKYSQTLQIWPSTGTKPNES